MFREQHHRDPGTDQELTGFLRRVSRPERSAVAGFDLTFSPVKSVSTLWAVAPREISERVEAAHAAAVAATLAVVGEGGRVHQGRDRRAGAGRRPRFGDGPVHPPGLPGR